MSFSRKINLYFMRFFELWFCFFASFFPSWNIDLYEGNIFTNDLVNYFNFYQYRLKNFNFRDVIHKKIKWFKKSSMN